MTKTAIELTEKEIAVFRATARQREEKERNAEAQRIQRGWELAKQAGTLLKNRFGAKRVIVFGSLARKILFHKRSDIDLAVEGIKVEDFWRASSALDRSISEFDIDLVDLATVSQTMRQEIEREGIEI